MTTRLKLRASRLLLAGCLILLTLGTVGCASRGDLSGKVSYQGKPLASGSVLLVRAGAIPMTTRIEEDGSYHFTDVPVGEVKLAVFSPDPAQEAEARKKAEEKRLSSSEKPLPPLPPLPEIDRSKWFAIPIEYRDVEHSGLRITINGGPNSHPIELK
jgi:hypothetical protein